LSGQPQSVEGTSPHRAQGEGEDVHVAGAGGAGWSAPGVGSEAVGESVEGHAERVVRDSGADDDRGGRLVVDDGEPESGGGGEPFVIEVVGCRGRIAISPSVM
jgi:hypothetical protein